MKFFTEVQWHCYRWFYMHPPKKIFINVNSGLLADQQIVPPIPIQPLEYSMLKKLHNIVRSRWVSLTLFALICWGVKLPYILSYIDANNDPRLYFGLWILGQNIIVYITNHHTKHSGVAVYHYLQTNSGLFVFCSPFLYWTHFHMSIKYILKKLFSFHLFKNVEKYMSVKNCGVAESGWLSYFLHLEPSIPF